MVDSPGLTIEICRAPGIEAIGPLAERAKGFALRVLESQLAPREMGCRIEVLSAPAEHAGLGVGTQLGMAVAAGLNALAGGPPRSAEELARSAGRGERSAVGLYGFIQGGMLIDRGKLPGERIAPPPVRLELPRDWRFVLARPRDAQGLSGADERTAFDELPPVPIDTTERLEQEAAERLVPALRAGDIEGFGESLHRFNRLAGGCFASRQGGPFSAAAAPWIETLRTWGIKGVGQSSWGPTVFALVADQESAVALAERLAQLPGGGELDLHIAAPAIRGATIEFRARSQAPPGDAPTSGAHPNSMDDLLPTAAQIARLPMRAAAAYAARTARRVSSGLRGIVPDDVIDNALRHMDAVSTATVIGDLEPGAIIRSTEKVSAACADAPPCLTSVETLRIVFCLTNASLAAMHVVLAARIPADAQYQLKCASESAVQAVRTGAKCRSSIGRTMIEAARRDYEILVAKCGETEDVFMGHPIDCFDDE